MAIQRASMEAERPTVYPLSRSKTLLMLSHKIAIPVVRIKAPTTMAEMVSN